MELNQNMIPVYVKTGTGKKIGIVVASVLSLWLLGNMLGLALASRNFSLEYQQRSQAVIDSQVELCKVERDWCTDKLSNPDDWSTDVLQSCAKKTKWNCVPESFGE